NGNSKKSLGRDSKRGIIILPPVSFEEHIDVQRETKARTLLLQSLFKDHIADFHHLDDARDIWLAMKARFGGNEQFKKIRKTMLKQEFSKFMYGLMAGYKSDFADHAVKECIGLDEAFELSTPSVFDPELENREVKSLYESDKSSELETYDFASCVLSPKTNDSFSTVDVKIFPKSDVKVPSSTNGFPSCSFKENVKPPRNLCNKSRIADRIHCKNKFFHTKTCFVCGSKSHLIKDCDVYDNVDNIPSVVSKATSVRAGSRNSSTSISADRSIPAASRNRPASIRAGR
nr:xylulose kinase-1 [Tanacetum cinerariifolium]